MRPLSHCAAVEPHGLGALQNLNLLLVQNLKPHGFLPLLLGNPSDQPTRFPSEVTAVVVLQNNLTMRPQSRCAAA